MLYPASMSISHSIDAAAAPCVRTDHADAPCPVRGFLDRMEAVTELEAVVSSRAPWRIDYRIPCTLPEFRSVRDADTFVGLYVSDGADVARAWGALARDRGEHLDGLSAAVRDAPKDPLLIERFRRARCRFLDRIVRCAERAGLEMLSTSALSPDEMDAAYGTMRGCGHRTVPEAVVWLLALDRGRDAEASRRRIEAARELAAVLPLLAASGTAFDDGSLRPRTLPRLLGVPRGLLGDIRGKSSLASVLNDHFTERTRDSSDAAGGSTALRRMRLAGLPEGEWPSTHRELCSAYPYWTKGASCLRMIAPPVLRAAMEERMEEIVPRTRVFRTGDTPNNRIDAFMGTAAGRELLDTSLLVHRWLARPLLNRLQTRSAGDRGHALREEELLWRLKGIMSNGRGPRHARRLLDALHARAGDLGAMEAAGQGCPVSWPALAGEWISESGTHCIVPITTARGLIAEGSAMHHCVGGYVERCGLLGSFVFSVRAVDAEGAWRRAATMELAGVRGSSPEHPWQTIRLEQLQGPANTPPSPEVEDACADFLLALVRGLVPCLGAAEIERHLKALAETKNRRDAPEEIEADAFPFFWDLLPGSRGLTLDQWVDRSGILDAGWRTGRPVRAQGVLPRPVP